MDRDVLVELAKDVATVHVRASALGETGVAAFLEMALDELLEVLAARAERLAEVVPVPEEVSEP